MIVSCPNCKKKFQIDANLLPEEGRDLQCGSCSHVWFYKEDKEKSSPLTSRTETAAAAEAISS